MKRVLSFICVLGVIVSSLLFAVSSFSTHLVSKSLVNSAFGEMHIKEKLQESLAAMGLPQSDVIASEIDGYIEEVLHDEKVIEELNKYTEAFLYDMAHDEHSTITSSLNEAIKNELLQYADDISALSSGFLPEESVRAILSSSTDIINVQALYDVVLEETKAQMPLAEMQLIKMVSTLQSRILYYASILVMAACSTLLIVLHRQEKEGFGLLGSAWGISGVCIVLGSLMVTPVLNLLTSNTLISQSVQDNISSLSKIGWIYLGICLACLLVRAFFNRKEQ